MTLWSSTGADPTSAFNEVAELPPEADRLVSWLPDAWTQERRMEPGNRVMIEAAYIRAWAAIGRYQATGDTGAIVATFSEPARRW